MARKTEKNLGRQSYEALSARLEEIVGRLEGGGLTLEESLEAFEEGVALARESENRLNEAEKRVEVLLASRDGRLTVQPADELAEPDAESDAPDEESGEAPDDGA